MFDFKMFNFIFRVFPVVVVLMFIFIVVKSILRFFHNEKAPVVSTNALLLFKNHTTDTNHMADGASVSTDSYYLAFELDTGSRVEYAVTRRIYNEAVENEWGTLVFQGTRFLRFEANNQSLIK